MKINTKVVFEWNDESKQYEEVYCESYDYDGEVAECQSGDDATEDALAAAGLSYEQITNLIHGPTQAASALPSAASMGLFGAGSSLISTAMPYLALGGMALGAITKRNQAFKQRDYIRDQQKQLATAGKSLEDVYGKKMGIFQEQFGEQLGQATYGAGESLFDVQQSGETLAGKTGLSYSGTVQRGLKRAREKVRKQFGFTKTGLENILGGQIMGLEEWKSGEEDRLKAEQQRLSYELKQAESATTWSPFD